MVRVGEGGTEGKGKKELELELKLKLELELELGRLFRLQGFPGAKKVRGYSTNLAY